jgi:hypothetical protein
VTENEKKVKAPANAKKKAPESAETKAKSVVKAKAVAGETKPRAKTAKTKEVTEPIAPVASSGPQRVPNKAKATTPAPTHQQIAQLAHSLWKERGGNHGAHEQDWLRAERELRGMAS